jgi:hypothetical protein
MGINSDKVRSKRDGEDACHRRGAMLGFVCAQIQTGQGKRATGEERLLSISTPLPFSLPLPHQLPLRNRICVATWFKIPYVSQQLPKKVTAGLYKHEPTPVNNATDTVSAGHRNIPPPAPLDLSRHCQRLGCDRYWTLERPCNAAEVTGVLVFTSLGCR